jgi:Fanconi anemia group M protein
MKILKEESFELREYQQSIAKIAQEQNTLVVLPTGMGKTLIAVLIAANRLEKHPSSKVLITAPTRPLNAQHKKSFENFTNIDPEKIVLITGRVNPEERAKLYEQATVVVATPQTIRNDLKNERIKLTDFSFIIFDEAHRCVKDYAYTFVAKKYIEQSQFPLILGLTASPGGSAARIKDIQENLFIKAVEIRSETDEDVEPYVKGIEKDWIYVDFPKDYHEIKYLIEEVLKDQLFWLRDHHFIQTLRPSRKLLLMLQNRIAATFKGRKNYALIWVMIKTAMAIKLEHAIELLETQNISSLNEYMKKIEASKKRTDQLLIKDQRMQDAMKKAEELKEIRHPKMEKLKDLVKDLTGGKHEIKIIVFANYRSTVDKIKKMLIEENVKTEEFIGQAVKDGKGMTQEKQIEILKRFKDSEFNVLVSTSIGEEGLDVPAVDYAIFYEPVPSEIRAIQRRGRVGRQTAGKIIFLITKNTRDEAYLWAAFQKEKKMKGILYNLQNKFKKKHKEKKVKRSLKDWVE